MHSNPCRRQGFTLVEMLVAMTITMILIFALSQAFAIVGQTVSEGRATIEMAGNLRAVGQRLEEDLLGVTVAVRPPADENGGPGYLEITDGSGTDDQSGQSETARGDCDDVLAFTTRSRGLPFAGSLVRSTGVTSIESPLAEVVWWTQRTDVNGNGSFDADEPYTIYRRVLLIRPDLDVSQQPFSLVNGQYALADARSRLMSFLNNNDVSVQIRAWTTGGGQLELHVAPNSLADLTLRQNRFAHYPVLVDVPAVAVHPQVTNNASGAAHSAFPFALDTNLTSITCLYRMPKGGGNTGQDVLVSNALALDVQVFDPGAPLIASANSGEALGPGDPAFWSRVLPQPPGANLPTNLIGLGAFVDLGYGQRHLAATAGWSRFSGLPQQKSGLSNVAYTYCTWTTYYERNGWNEDNDYAPGSNNTVPLIDEGTDGFDNDNQNGVDDAGELETAPPYATPLRGLQVRVRAWDPDSRQVRQMTVVSDFVPE